MNCRMCDNVLTGRQTKYCSSQCRMRGTHVDTYARNKDRWRAEREALLPEDPCVICKVVPHRDQRHFHHIDPNTKEHAIGSLLALPSKERITN